MIKIGDKVKVTQKDHPNCDSTGVVVAGNPLANPVYNVKIDGCNDHCGCNEEDLSKIEDKAPIKGASKA